MGELVRFSDVGVAVGCKSDVVRLVAIGGVVISPGGWLSDVLIGNTALSLCAPIGRLSESVLIWNASRGSRGISLRYDRMCDEWPQKMGFSGCGGGRHTTDLPAMSEEGGLGVRLSDVLIGNASPGMSVQLSTVGVLSLSTTLPSGGATIAEGRARTL